MKRPPRLHLEPRPSHLARAAIVTLGVATAMLVIFLSLPWWFMGAALAAVACVVGQTVSRCAGRGVPAFVIVGDDRRLTVSSPDGTSRDGSVLADTYVGAWLTCVVWQTDDAPWWKPARTLLFLPDTLAADESRRLRVLLRYGVPNTRAERKGVVAG